MRPYDPNSLLVSIHVPKCAGTSFEVWLKAAFGPRLHLHYPDTAPPDRCPGTAGHCVHGHFYHHEWDISVGSYYPAARQHITILRNPVEMMASSYFYQCKMNSPPAVYLDTYLESVLAWPRLFTHLGLPLRHGAVLDKDEVAAKFVWLGCVEHMEISLKNLTTRLNLTAPPEMPYENSTPRNGSAVDLPRWEDAFRVAFPWDYELYDLAVDLNRNGPVP